MLNKVLIFVLFYIYIFFFLIPIGEVNAQTCQATGSTSYSYRTYTVDPSLPYPNCCQAGTGFGSGSCTAFNAYQCGYCKEADMTCDGQCRAWTGTQPGQGPCTTGDKPIYSDAGCGWVSGGGGGGTPTPAPNCQTCLSQGYECGSFTNNCGQTLNCGSTAPAGTCSGCMYTSYSCSNHQWVANSPVGSSLCNSACSGTKVCAGCMLTNTTCNAQGQCVANSAAGQVASSTCNYTCSGTWTCSGSGQTCGQTCNSSGQCVNNSATCPGGSCPNVTPAPTAPASTPPPQSTPVPQPSSGNGSFVTCYSCTGSAGSCAGVSYFDGRTCNTDCSACSGGGGAPLPSTYSISGSVFLDANNNRSKDPNETNYTGSITITARSGCGFFGLGCTSHTVTYPSQGNFSAANLNNGTYTIRYTNPPSGYTVTTPNANFLGQYEHTITLPCSDRTSPTCESYTGLSGITFYSGNAVNINFGLLDPRHTISGSVFIDANGDGRKNIGESNYTGGISITSSGTGDVSTYPNPGSFRITNAQAGLRTISYTNLPAGYRMTYPINGPPPSFRVRVGPACDDGGSPDASCTIQNNIINLNYGISIDTGPWIQATGGNVRVDSGINNDIPSTASPACQPANSGGPFMSLPGSGGEPGIVYSGDNSADFGNGQASSTNWIVSGPDGKAYNPPTPNTIRTSYGYIMANAGQQGLTINDLAPYCSGGLNNCTLGNLPTGIYKTTGNLTLNSYNVPSGRNIIILIGPDIAGTPGNLTLRGNIDLPRGSTIIFSASRDIYIDTGVGEVSNTSSNPNLEGIFSADRDFIIRGTNNCSVGPDRRLNVEGNVISNAALSGGSFTVQRDLCSGNICPSVSIVQRLDLVVNLPPLLRAPNLIWKEVAP